MVNKLGLAHHGERRAPFLESEDQKLRIFSGTQGSELIQDQKERQFRIEIENGL